MVKPMGRLEALTYDATHHHWFADLERRKREA
jgi:hypothetical protein